MLEEKLNCIMLIDDDEPTNFLHETVIKSANCTEKIITVTSGTEGLDFLKEKVNGAYPQPDLIFLDINMPGMNGWEFLEEYKKLQDNQKGKTVVIMLTTSLNPDDRERAAKELGSEAAFKSKPLKETMLEEVLKTYFPEKF